LAGKYEKPDGSDEDALQLWDDVNSVAKLTMKNNCGPEVRARIGAIYATQLRKCLVPNGHRDGPDVEANAENFVEISF